MAIVKELICTESDGTLSFGNYELDTKSKVSGFEYYGDSYKVKTFKEITKLERNEMFVFESVPGTAVHHFKVEEDCISFTVECPTDAQITLELEAETEYETFVDGVSTGVDKTNLGGKLVLSIEGGEASIKVVRA